MSKCIYCGKNFYNKHALRIFHETLHEQDNRDVIEK